MSKANSALLFKKVEIFLKFILVSEKDRQDIIISMDTDELLKLIIASPINEEKKQELISALKAGAPVDDVVAGYEATLNAMSEEIIDGKYDVQKVSEGATE